MRNRRSTWTLVVLILAGALVGGIAGEFLSNLPYLGWMSFGGTGGYRDLFAVSLHPALDIRILKVGFDLALGINAGSIIGIMLGILIFIKI